MPNNIKKTDEKIKIGNRNAVVYIGQRGGKYVKIKGEFVNIRKVGGGVTWAEQLETYKEIPAIEKLSPRQIISFAKEYIRDHPIDPDNQEDVSAKLQYAITAYEDKDEYDTAFYYKQIKEIVDTIRNGNGDLIEIVGPEKGINTGGKKQNKKK
jgi:hypothetical protein